MMSFNNQISRISRYFISAPAVLAAIFFAGLIFISCDEKAEPVKTKKVDIKKDSSEAEPEDTIKTEPRKIDTLKPKPIKRVDITTNYNNLANFISGHNQKEKNELTPYEDSVTWKNYSRFSNSRWARLKRLKLNKMAKFRDTQLADINRNTNVLFYPFGGPDFLHAYEFFPYADKFILVGLEKVGSLPGVHNMAGDSAMINYFNMIKKSLHMVLAVSFFRTIDMKEDFQSEELDGILPVLLIFCNRTGSQIVDIKPFVLNEAGDIVYRNSDEFAKFRYVEISLIDRHGENKTLYYMSKNLNNNGVKPDYRFVKFIKKAGKVTTYLKAASYLMHHEDGFSNIRDLILQQSNYVIQDDSGIPLVYFPETKWDLYFYGSYVKPIELFKERYQENLAAIYLDSARILPLDFGIGYQHRKGNSNLMVAIKKK